MIEPTLLLLPNLLDENAPQGFFLPASVEAAVRTMDGLIAESPKGGRTFLRRFSFPAPKVFSEIPIFLFNEHTPDKEIDSLLKPILKGERWGYVSDCGLSCLADPGAKLVFRARELGIAVDAFMGPSSIVLALLLSGLPAQSFAFHGYLERDLERLRKQILKLEKRSLLERSTHLFIETPYKSQKMLEQLLKVLSEETLLSVCWDITLPTQGVITQRVKQWRRREMPLLHKKPAVYLFSSS